MRQIVVVGEVFRGWGRVILEGLRRFVSVMCFLVVRIREIVVEVSSSESSSSVRRLGFPLEVVLEALAMWFRRALEAFSV